MATKTDMPKERRKNFNYIQADYDIFCRSDDEDEDVELNARNTQKEYGSKTTVKTANDLHCKRPSRRRTLYL